MAGLNRNYYQFYFVRHCQTLWNEQSLCQGTVDTSLSPQGRKQAYILSQKLLNISLDTMLISDRIRAQQTANIIKQSCLGIKDCQSFAQLQERAFGRLEGLPSLLMYSFEQLEQEGLLTQQAYKSLDVETLESFIKRITVVKEHIVKLCEEDRTVLVVSHGRVFNALCDILQAQKIKQLEHNCVIRFFQQGSSWCYDEVDTLC